MRAAQLAEESRTVANTVANNEPFFWTLVDFCGVSWKAALTSESVESA